MNRRASRPAETNELDDGIRELADCVGQLKDEVEVLWQAVDDLRETLSHDLRSLRDALPVPISEQPYRLDSMPADPCVDDFHDRVNAVDARVFAQSGGSIPAERVRPKTVEEFVQGLVQQRPTGQLDSADWAEEQEFTPGEVVAIEASIFDWFAENLVSVHYQDDWFIADDGLGTLFLLWTRPTGCFVRCLTDDEQQTFGELAEVPFDEKRSGNETPAPPPAGRMEEPQPTSQQTLW